MTKRLIAYVLSLLALTLAGCATTQDKHLDKTVAAGADSQELPPPDGFARVYFLRPKAWGQDFNPLIPAVAPPIYAGVDGELVATMPLGSHVVLALWPGLHRFQAYAPVMELSGPTLKRWDLETQVEAGKIYYVAHRIGFPHHKLVVVDAADARGDMGVSSRAKFLVNPAGTDDFERKFKELVAKRADDRKAAFEQKVNALIPSSQTIGNVLEGIAAVALVALVVVGGVALVAAGGSGAMPAVASPPSAPLVYEAPRRVSTVSGGLIETTSSARREAVVTNYSTGTKYKIEGDRVTGSDGSRYRFVGTQLISDSGPSYTVIGNSVFGADGSSCDRIGEKIYCKNGR